MTKKNHFILLSKGRGTDIIVSDFLLLQSLLNILSLSKKDYDNFVNSEVLLEAIEYFEYEKINDGYQKKKYLLKQVIEKVLSIVKVLYLKHQLLFSFDNVISYSIFA